MPVVLLHDRRGVLVRLSPKGEAAIREVTPFVRRVNDVLFQHVTAKDLTMITEFLSALALNTEYAAAEIRRSERERNTHKSASVPRQFKGIGG